MIRNRLGALVAAGVLAGGLSTGATAADLGGNCCADLEERIAELEATTARKGNRKVSLTVSGWVAHQVMWWDDDYEENVYVSGLGTTLASHVKFTGQATIRPGWSAGYVLHIEAIGSDALLGINQDVDNGPSVYTGSANDAHLLQSFWFMKSDQLGKLSVGLQSQASDNTAILVDGSGSLVPANFVQFDYGGFFLRDGGGALSGTTISDVMACTDCNGLPTNSVRYDSPSFGGFSVSASWGEDDFWDVAARYAGEWNGIKIAIAGAYAEANDDDLQPLLSLGGDASHFQIGGYVEHVPTGLFAYGAYSRFDADHADFEGDNYYIKAGLRQRFSPLGHTVFYGEYQDGEQEGFDSLNGDVELWGLGVVQEIDAAAMSMWLSYRNIEASGLDGVCAACGEPDVSTDFQYIKFGALINF